MFQKIIKRLFYKRHYWRDVGFDDLSKIYSNMFLRSFALSVISVFVPVYLYKIGFSVVSILTMYIFWFLFRIAFSPLVAKLISIFGLKHTVALATVAHIVYLTMLMTIQDLHWPLISVALVGSLAAVTFLIAHEVNFSRIKDVENGGKELGFVQIFEKLGTVIGPLAGGLLANYTDPRYTLGLAITILTGSLIPIFLSTEPNFTYKRVVFKRFPFKRHRRDFYSSAALTVENTISTVIWPFFISITVFTSNTFAKLGLIASLSTVVALIAIYSIGKLVDEEKGGMLLNAGAISNSILHLFRPFVGGIGQVIGVGIVNEPVTTAYRLPYLKGRFDAADQVIGYRVLYFSVTDMLANVANVLVWSLLLIIALIKEPIFSLKVSFFIASVASLLIMSQKFRSLR